jgi:hypothetical protein
MRFATRTYLIAVIGLLLAIAAPPAMAQEGANQRPIEDWIDQQGTYCIDDGSGGCFLIVPPIENFLGFSDPGSMTSASVDYAGLANDWIEAASGGATSFDTTFSGSITERPLRDGRVEVNVRLRTDNALAWVVDGSDYANDPLLFGNRAPAVLAGAESALVSSHLTLRFINTAPGANLPDLIQLLVAPEEGQELRFIGFEANGEGPLADDGGLGRLHVVQRGLLMTSFQGAVADGFPVEKILLKPVGG